MKFTFGGGDGERRVAAEDAVSNRIEEGEDYPYGTNRFGLG